jgi:probable phosphoglycerate mutase
VTISYVLRHGRTTASAAYIASCDPRQPIHLDAEGTRQCLRHAGSAWTAQVVTCVTSEFPRAIQTAELLMRGRQLDIVVDARLNEINYGEFEGGPWRAYGAWLSAHGVSAVPPGGESRVAALTRMFHGLAACLALPGPRLIVGHGLTISTLLRRLDGGSPDRVDLPEAPYVEPITLTDPCLVGLIGTRPNIGQRSSAGALT